MPGAPRLHHQSLPPVPLPTPGPQAATQTRTAPPVLLTRLPDRRAPAATGITTQMNRTTSQPRPERRLTTTTETTMLSHDHRWSLPPGNTPVPSRWQATPQSRQGLPPPLRSAYRTACAYPRPAVRTLAGF